MIYFVEEKNEFNERILLPILVEILKHSYTSFRILKTYKQQVGTEILGIFIRDTSLREKINFVKELTECFARVK